MKNTCIINRPQKTIKLLVLISLKIDSAMSRTVNVIKCSEFRCELAQLYKLYPEINWIQSMIPALFEFRKILADFALYD